MLPFAPEARKAVRVVVLAMNMESPPESDNDKPTVSVVPPICRLGVPAMGCLFEVMIWHEDAEWSVGVAREALAEIERLDRQLSHYRDDSDIARLNARAHWEWVRVEPSLFRLLERCKEWSDATDGAFDITTGALLECWGFHRGAGRVPHDDEISNALKATGMDAVLLEPAQCMVHFSRPHLTLNLGAVGKGFALDQAASVLRFYGVQSALLHGGRSTILALGHPPDADAWRFDIRDPRDRRNLVASVALRDAALSTSGSYEQYVEADGMRYGHILDPQTGRAVSGVVLCSAIADTAARSDALSTALFVMGPERARRWAERTAGARFVLLAESTGGRDSLVTVGLP